GARELAESFDDGGERRRRVVVDVVVGDADAALGREVRADVVEEHLEDAVAVAVDGDRAEEAERADPPSEHVGEAERDERLAGVALGRGDVHAARVGGRGALVRGGVGRRRDGRSLRSARGGPLPRSGRAPAVDWGNRGLYR